jgi:N-acetylmuramoyl-L-alanine amidase
VLLCSVLCPGGLRAAALGAGRVRSWSAPDHTRIVFDLDADLPFDSRMFHDPETVVLEIRGAVVASPWRKTVEDQLVRSISVEPSGGGALVKVELVRPAGYAAFPLPPNSGGDSHRIVLDVLKKLTDAEKQAQDREAEAVRRSGDAVVVVDAGHGGNDPGCEGNNLVESRLALDVAKRLAACLGERPGIRAILTRDGDYFLPLSQRPQVARRYGAQVFVSIHTNSASSAAARGVEVFFLSLEGAADKAAKELVDRENAADLVGGVPPERLQEPIVDILMNLKQNDTMRRSEHLGERVLERLDRVSDAKRGLKQGPLAVLKSIGCPSVLVELGFLTNVQDAKLLRDERAKQRYAQQIALGIEDYLKTSP